MARKHRKNGNGEGSVSRRKDGYWVTQRAVNVNGTIKYLQYYGKAQKEAIKKRDEARVREESGLVFEAGRTNVGEYLDRWLLVGFREA